jgi:hypothetical protein
MKASKTGRTNNICHALPDLHSLYTTRLRNDTDRGQGLQRLCSIGPFPAPGTGGKRRIVLFDWNGIWGKEGIC